MNEPNEKTLDRNEVADLPERRLRPIQPENNLEPDTTNDEPGLMTTIHMNKEQLDKQLKCAVCLDDFVINEKAMKLLCDHIFHKECITHWIIVHGTCPVCRRYYCPDELHLPQERVSPPINPTVAQRLYRIICSPFACFFPGLASVPAGVNTNRRQPNWSTPMYRLVGAEHVISEADCERFVNEIYDSPEYDAFNQIVTAMQNAQNEQLIADYNAVVERMRSPFWRPHCLLELADVDPAGVNPPPPSQSPQPPQLAAEGQGFEMPTDVTTTEYVGHY